MGNKNSNLSKKKDKIQVSETESQSKFLILGIHKKIISFFNFCKIINLKGDKEVANPCYLNN